MNATSKSLANKARASGDKVTFTLNMAPPSPPPPAQPSITCTHHPMWDYLMEVEDDKSKDDMPALSEIADGYSNANAYYKGNAFLESANLGLVELCAGVKNSGGDSCQIDCVRLKETHLGAGIKSGAYAPKGITSQYKKMIACFTGQCPGNAYSSGFFWVCPKGDDCDTRPYGWASFASTSPSSWNVPGERTDYISGWGPHSCSGAICMHNWGSGLTLRVGTTDNIASNAAGAVHGKTLDLWQIRYK